VPGSVLVWDGTAYCVAGRSMFLDGGLRMVGLDAETGEKLFENVMDETNPETGKTLQHDLKWPNLPTALPDVLSCDGKQIYMRAQPFDLSGKRTEVGTDMGYGEQAGENAHLFCPTGFLDDNWWHRSYWLYGESFLGGAGGWWAAGHYAPSGRPLTMDASGVYGYGRQPHNYRGTTVMDYHLFATDRDPGTVGYKNPATAIPKNHHVGVPPHKDREGITSSHPKFRWTREVPFHARAVALTADIMFAAGAPDLVDEEEIFNNPIDEEARELLERQAAALEGDADMHLWAVRISDGRPVAKMRLGSVPVFDGMSAARGRLLISRKDGTLVCLGGE
jgi:hypothetical protein